MTFFIGIPSRDKAYRQCLSYRISGYLPAPSNFGAIWQANCLTTLNGTDLRKYAR